MKNLINLSIILFTIISLSFFSSCTQDSLSDLENPNLDTPTEMEEYPHFHDEICNHVKQVDIDLDNLEVIDFEFPDGTSEQRFLIEDDVAITRAALEQLKEDRSNGLRQYHTNNLVTSPRVIRIIGFTGGGGYGLSDVMQLGLNWAVTNYRMLNMDLTLELRFTNDLYNLGNHDIFIYRVVNGEVGGIAEFPSGGNPGKFIQIYDGMDNYSVNVNEHVMTHEIGHCLGLRHTDWNTRVSCNEWGEGAGTDGAVHIPGTPVGTDWNSVMLACFSSSTDGELGYYDKVALEELY